MCHMILIYCFAVPAFEMLSTKPCCSPDARNTFIQISQNISNSTAIKIIPDSLGHAIKEYNTSHTVLGKWNSIANFGTLYSATCTLLEMTLVSSWPNVMEAASAAPPIGIGSKSYFFFYIFYFIFVVCWTPLLAGYLINIFLTHWKLLHNETQKNTKKTNENNEKYEKFDENKDVLYETETKKNSSAVLNFDELEKVKMTEI